MIGARPVLVVLALVMTLAACGGDDGGGGGDGGLALPACAAELPLPDGLEVVEVTAEPSDDNPTCAVTLASDAAIDDVVGAWRTALDDDGVAHEDQHQAGVRAVLQLEGPVCGSILVFAAGTDRVTDAVPADRTPALASILECPSE